MSKEKILIVDDEDEIVNLVAKYLSREGYRVFCTFNGREALHLAYQEIPDLIILDIMLPDIDGIELCRQLRKEGMVIPILLISAKTDESDKVLGLGIGADDYITKPFSPNELVARVKAHLRRVRLLHTESKSKERRLTFTTMEIDLLSREVKVEGALVPLTAKEFELLCFLANHPYQVFSREQLFEKIWGFDAAGDDRTVMVHIRHLREKIEKDPNRPRYIKTVWGIGYKFVPS